MGARFSYPIQVEIYESSGNHWMARNSNAKGLPIFEKIETGVGFESMQKNVEACFTKQLEPWKMWGTADAAIGARPLLASEIQARGDHMYLKEKEDYEREAAIAGTGKGEIPDGSKSSKKAKSKA